MKARDEKVDALAHDLHKYLERRGIDPMLAAEVLAVALAAVISGLSSSRDNAQLGIHALTAMISEEVETMQANRKRHRGNGR